MSLINRLLDSINSLEDLTGGIRRVMGPIELLYSIEEFKKNVAQ
jgi:hypothetical protein